MSTSLSQALADINQGRITAQDTKPIVTRPPQAKPSKPKPKPASKSGDVKTEDAGKARGKLTGQLGGKSNGVTNAPRTMPSTITAAVAIRAGTTTGASVIDPSMGVLAKRVKDVLLCLEEYNGTQITPAQLMELTGHDLEHDTELLHKISRHERIQWSEGPWQFSANVPLPAAPAAWFTYRPEVMGVYDKAALLKHIRDHKGPAQLVAQLRKCYLQASSDLVELRAEGYIFIIAQPDADKDVVYVCDMMGQQGIGEDVRDHWFKVCSYEWIGSSQVEGAVPFGGVLDLQEAVVKAGLRSALANQPIKRVAPGGPRERKRQRTERKVNIAKATNAHMPQLFMTAQPKTLDGL